MTRLAGLLALAAVLAPGAAVAQEASGRAAVETAMRAAYIAAEPGVRAQYEALLNELGAAPGHPPPEWSDKTRKLMATLSYNQAAVFAICAGDAERDRNPQAPRVPAGQNLVLRTCVEIKMTQLNKFSERVGYADMFFPARIEPCGEKVRLKNVEAMLKPYDFLFLDEPRVYDFGRYNDCLMAPQ